MRKLSRLSLLVSVLGMLLAASAMAAPAKKPPAAPAAGAAKSVHGIVKGAPTGTTFVVAAKGGAVTVDGKKAKVRENGKFTSFSNIKAGLMVTVKGTEGPKGTVVATDITIFPKKKK